MHCAHNVQITAYCCFTWIIHSTLLGLQFRVGDKLLRIGAVCPQLETAVLKGVNPFRTAVPFGGKNTQISSSVPPKRDYGPKRVKIPVLTPFLLQTYTNIIMTPSASSPQQDCSHILLYEHINRGCSRVRSNPAGRGGLGRVESGQGDLAPGPTREILKNHLPDPTSPDH